MFDLFNGLPVHPFVVHGVVVLLPLAIAGTIAIAVHPAWRHRYGHLVVAASAMATALIPVATSSGEALEQHVGDPGQHAQLGDQLLWFALPLLILDVALVLLTRRTVGPIPGATTDTAASQSKRYPHRLLTAVATLSIVAAVAAGVQVYRVGDSGARAAWGDQVSAH